MFLTLVPIRDDLHPLEKAMQEKFVELLHTYQWIMQKSRDTVSFKSDLGTFD